MSDSSSIRADLWAMSKDIERALNECVWLESGDRAAPVRIRKILQEVKGSAHRVRMNVLSKSKNVVSTDAEDLENQSPKKCSRRIGAKPVKLSNIPPEGAQVVSSA
jgi:hypothetical protein